MLPEANVLANQGNPSFSASTDSAAASTLGPEVLCTGPADDLELHVSLISPGGTVNELDYSLGLEGDGSGELQTKAKMEKIFGFGIGSRQRGVGEEVKFFDFNSTFKSCGGGRVALELANAPDEGRAGDLSVPLIELGEERISGVLTGNVVHGVNTNVGVPDNGFNARDTGLTDMDGNNFSHDVECGLLSYQSENKKLNSKNSDEK